MRTLLAFLLAAFVFAGCQDTEPNVDPAPDLVGESPAPPPSDAPSATVDVDRLIAAGRGSGTNLASLIDALPRPDRTTAQPYQNRHVAGQVDTLRTYEYPGVRFTVYEVSGANRQMLRGLTVTTDAYATEGVRVGDGRAQVEATLGAPDARTGGDWEYRFGEPTQSDLHLAFAADTVREWRWSFYID